MPASAKTTNAVQRHRQRIEDLIAAMTIEEKAGQVNLLADPFRWMPKAVNPLDGTGSPARVTALIREGKVGALFNGIGAEAGRRIQRVAMEETRLKIPLLFAADVIHGLSTIFPVPLAEAAAFDTDLAYRTARAAAIETAASAVHQTYAPMVDVARDQRWGRNVEGAGEDVLLNNLLAAARVRGFQGEKGLDDRDAVLATAKHMAAYSAALGGVDYNTTDMSEQTLRGVFLPPFKASVDAGALSIMSAFNDLNGVPTSGNYKLLTEILRGEWGFEGFVLSDYTSEQELIAHGFAEDGRDAARIAFNAGVDVSMVSGLYLEHLPDLVRSGEVSMGRLDEAVRRVLTTKAALGLFDDPYRGTDPEREKAVVGARKHIELAREAGRKSVVLLKNQGNLLPLDKNQKIALIGPFADDVDNVWGPWTIWGDPERRVSLEAGFRAAMNNPQGLSLARGSDVETSLPGGIDEAVRVANTADVVVLAIGESQRMSGEAQSRTEIVVPSAQQALVDAIAATGKPFVILLRNGRGLALEGGIKNAPAIVVTWFLGEQMGHSVADVIFGDHSPTARLPVSFPHRSGQQPYSYDRKNTGRPANPDLAEQEFTARYRETPNTALYPFGFGLTYGDIVYGPIEMETNQLPWAGSISVSASVTNQGRREAEELVQLYIHDRVASLTQPGRLLKDFKRISLRPGQTEKVTFTLNPRQLGFIGADEAYRIEPGLFDVWIAPHAQGGVTSTFHLVGPTAVADGG
ncbi:beta-glucosidase BglX [Brevundimonas nasdae]|uniref:beta-glucosidase n=2 Tax=Brevundimonas nasdae TaxID=172043 RepID=A0ABX8TR16_9CAUL|nr:beta-glucosidase BglX [Brevundimonas nasdae]QYC15953.1 beta-glucosidase BglX [Brevundimonas nasdae]